VLRTLRAFSVLLCVCAVSIPAAAQDPGDDAPAGEVPAAKDKGAAEAAPESETKAANEAHAPTRDEPSTAPPSAVEAKPPEPEGWRTELHGYFRAPMALSFSSRPGPDNLSGPSSRQISYGPNRTVDASYYSFAYTRLQEQDWSEVFIHEKTRHLDGVIGWMGYWYQSVGFRNPDASWVPGMAYVTLDTDFDAGAIKPNVALTMGAWWPKFGYFEKYDTYTLGRFRQLGEQIQLTVPFSDDITAVLTEGFGTARDGSFNYLAPPYYGAIVGLDLLTWENVQLSYKNNVDVSLHYNTEWTEDPNLTTQTTAGKSFSDAKLAHLTVVGGEANLRAPVAGHLWISPSYIDVRNGWALANGGTEVMHGLSGVGIATNYLGWTNTPQSSTGSGSMTNLGVLYENSLSNIQRKPAGSVLPDVAVSVFGLFTKSKLDLPAGSTFPQNSFKQIKYGADATLQALDWLGFMVRYDLVNMDMDHGGYIFSGITARASVSSHFLSSARVYLQYTRYTYGNQMTLAGTRPWGAPIVAGNEIIQAGPYAGKQPDRNVVKIQAELAF
jgi:hypothetical protein